MNSLRFTDLRVDVLAEHLGQPMTTTGCEVRFNSPFREHFQNPRRADRKYHLYVNLRKGMFMDWKSGLSGSLSYLFRLLGEDEPDQAKRAPATPLESLRERCKALGARSAFWQPTAPLPEWYTPVRSGSAVHAYLKGRGLTDADISLYRIGEGMDDHSDEVIVPSYLDGKCEYWVSRSIQKKRYLNPTSPRRYHVGFLEIARTVSPFHAILCEGVFSAIVAGRDAIATYGKFVSDFQLTRLQQAGISELTVALDSDAFCESMKTCKRAVRKGFTVYWVELPKDKDPADLGRETFRFLLQFRVPISVTEILRQRLRRISPLPAPRGAESHPTL